MEAVSNPKTGSKSTIFRRISTGSKRVFDEEEVPSSVLGMKKVSVTGRTRIPRVVTFYLKCAKIGIFLD
jgi:hypothetical protein